MKILFHLHTYPPHCFAGAEMMAHRIAKYLKNCGHDIKVLTQVAKEPIEFFEGIEVRKFELRDDEYWRWADLVITHLGNTNHCFNQQKRFRKKLVHLIHNSFDETIRRARVLNNYMVYNSEFAKESLKYKHHGMICIPPVDYRDYLNVDNSKGKFITLVNLNENKGGFLLPEIARLLPGEKFLGVEGGYYEQNKKMLPNLRYWTPQKDMKVVYEQSKIVLILSEYESWGQVAIEAIASGVPVVSTKATGVMKALGYAATYVNRDAESIVEGIKKLNDSVYYSDQKGQGLKRAKELDPLPYLKRLNDFLLWVNTKQYYS